MQTSPVPREVGIPTLPSSGNQDSGRSLRADSGKRDAMEAPREAGRSRRQLGTAPAQESESTAHKCNAVHKQVATKITVIIYTRTHTHTHVQTQHRR